jgi:hypothetical protein
MPYSIDGLRFSQWAKLIAHKYSIRQDISDAVGQVRRLDAGETMFLTNQLKEMIKDFFNIEVPVPLALQILPVLNDGNPGAEVYPYAQYEFFGQAKTMTASARDIPMINGQGLEFDSKYLSNFIGFETTFQQLRAAALANVPISSQFAIAAKFAQDARLDEIASIGDSNYGKTGFINDATIPLIAAITGTWSAATTAQIYADVAKLVNSIRIATHQIHKATDLLIDQTSWQYFQRAYAAGSDTTLAEYIEKNLKVKIEVWERLDLANAGGTGARIVAFEKNPMAMFIKNSVPFEVFGPYEEGGTSYVTKTHSRTAGFVAPYPYAAAYMDP